MDTYDEMTMDTELVTDLLNEHSWTWADLAREMGINKSTMNRVVRGETLPGRKFIFALMDVFPDTTQLFVPLSEVMDAVKDDEVAA